MIFDAMLCQRVRRRQTRMRCRTTPTNFLFSEAAAGKIYRQKFREAMRASGFEKNVEPSVWRKDWVVDVEPVHDGRAVLKYLAPYVFRVAISDNRILECHPDQKGAIHRISQLRPTLFWARRRATNAPRQTAASLVRNETANKMAMPGVSPDASSTPMSMRA